ncbi:MAG: hypothetical protein LC130_35325 [Bryobacterales bacterium]|nr:hypothetical protein [Bryobacterales bacterium]
MIRREFLKRAGLCAAGAVAPQSTGAEPVVSPDLGPSPIMKSFTPEDHRRRLQRIRDCEQSIRVCLKRHLITGYIPGQVSYNLGEYPTVKPYDPDEYDERELDRLRDGGIRLVQIMEDWNDMLRLFGGDKFTAVNPAGLKRFRDMVHKRGMKLLLYVSTGYMQAGDPDLRDEWVRGQPGPVGQAAHWRLVRCNPASPGWRAYLLPKTVQVLEEYGPDGLYNDWGYVNQYRNPLPPARDEVNAFKEAADHDAALEDLLSLVYSEVKRRGGIYKMHADFNDKPATKTQLYDYLWVGEGIGKLDKTRLETKSHPPYVVPCFDFRNGTVANDEEQFLHTIPYMQFPLLLAGRPFTGERALVPGVPYQSEDKDKLLRQWRGIFRYYKSHADGPFVYGPWDAFPPRPNVKETHARWLKRYLPMVQEGTWAYLEITDSSLFKGPLPRDTVGSVFTNLDTWVVLANYGSSTVNVQTIWDLSDTETSSAPSRYWTLGARSLRILRRV